MGVKPTASAEVNGQTGQALSLHHLSRVIVEQTLVLAKLIYIETFHLTAPVGSPHGEGLALGHNERDVFDVERNGLENIDDGKMVARNAFYPEQIVVRIVLHVLALIPVALLVEKYCVAPAAEVLTHPVHLTGF